MSAPTARSRAAGILLIAISAASFGAMPIFARFAYADGVSPVTLLAFRFVAASLIMLLILRLRRRSLPRGPRLVGLVLMGAVGYVGQSLCYFTALLHASAGMVALLLYLYPALVALLAAAALGERLTAPRLAALCLALAGSVLIVGGGDAEPAGILLGIGAAVIYSVYIVAGTRLVPAGGATEASAVVMLSAGAVYAVAAGFAGLHLPATAAGYAALAAIAAISTVVAIVTFFAGLQRVGPTGASTLSTLEPVVTVALAAIFLGESLNAGQAVGGALVLAAVLILARGERPRQPRDGRGPFW